MSSFTQPWIFVVDVEIGDNAWRAGGRIRQSYQARVWQRIYVYFPTFKLSIITSHPPPLVISSLSNISPPFTLQFDSLLFLIILLSFFLPPSLSLSMSLSLSLSLSHTHTHTHTHSCNPLEVCFLLYLPKGNVPVGDGLAVYSTYAQGHRNLVLAPL